VVFPRLSTVPPGKSYRGLPNVIGEAMATLSAYENAIHHQSRAEGSDHPGHYP
jgi:hypothetical protein